MKNALLIFSLFLVTFRLNGQIANPEGVAPPGGEAPPEIGYVQFHTSEDLNWAAQYNGMDVPVATLPYTTGVSALGGSTIQVGMNLPSGAGGLTPQLSFNYDSNGPEGIMGLGWSLGASSIITRGNKTLFFDGVVAPISENSSVFYLDGQRLLQTNVTVVRDGVVWGIYEKEVHDYSRIEAALHVENGVPDWSNPRSFVVRTREGMIYSYGIVPKSEPTNTWDIYRNMNDIVFAFYLSKVEDRNGNYYTIEYSKFGNNIGMPTLKRILYGMNGPADQAALYEIMFNYKSKPIKNQKAIPDFHLVFDELLLENVSLKYVPDKTNIREHVFKYSTQRGVSYLSTIEGYEGGVFYGVLKKEYSLRQGSLSLQNIGNTRVGELFLMSDNFLETSEPTLLRFLSNNGASDIELEISSTRVNVDGGYYTSHSSFQTSSLPAAPAIGQLTNREFHSLPEIQTIMRSNTGNYNGLNRSMILIPEGIRHLYNNTQTPLKIEFTSLKARNINANGTYSNLINFDNPLITFGPFPTRVSTALVPARNPILTGDLDGNSQADLFTFLYLDVVTNSIQSNFPSLWAGLKPRVYINGSSTPTDITFINTPGNNNLSELQFLHMASTFILEDINGDGKSELLVFLPNQYGLRIYTLNYNNGLCTAQLSSEDRGIIVNDNSPEFLSNHPNIRTWIEIRDLNGDGFPELIGNFMPNPTNQIRIFLGTGSGFVEADAPQNLTARFHKNNAFKLVDLNGDGTSEVLSIDKSGSFARKIVAYEVVGIIPAFQTGNRAQLILDEFTFIEPQFTQALFGESIDTDGNGAKELVIRTYNVNSVNGNIHYNSYLLKTVEFNPSDNLFPKDKLISIGDNSGLVVSFNYKALTEFNEPNPVYSATPANFSGNFGTGWFPMQVVSSKSDRAHDGIMRETIFTYEDLIYNRRGKGILGFKSSTSYIDHQEIFSKIEKTLNTSHASLLPTLQRTWRGTKQISQTSSAFSFGLLASGARVVQLQNEIASNLLTGQTETTTYIGYTSAGVPTSVSKNKGNGLETIEENLTYGNNNFPHLPTQKITKTKRGTGLFHAITENYTYDAKGRLSSRTLYPNTPHHRNETFTYDDYGLVISKATMAGGITRTTTNTYVQGRLLTEKQVDGGYKEREEFHLPTGRTVKAISTDNTETEVLYNSIGEPYQVIGTTGVTSTKEKIWAINEGGALYKEVYEEPGSPLTTTWYDYAGNEIKSAQQINYNGPGMVEQVVVLQTFDSRGRLLTKSDPHRVGIEAAVYTTFTYDSHDRVLSQAHPVLGTATYTYAIENGCYKTTVTKPGGQGTLVSSNFKDASGRLVKTTDDGGSVETVYNNQLMIDRILVSGVQVSKFEYLANGLKSKHIEANAGTTEYEYNAFDELILQRDARNQVEQRTYDNLGRVLTVSAAGSTTTYEYFPANAPLGKAGKLKKLAIGNDNYEEYDYDIYGRNTITTVKHPGENPLVSNRIYNAYNQLMSYTFPSGIAITYSYNAIGELRTISRNGSVVYRMVNVNGRGQVLSSKRAADQMNTVNEYNHGFPTQTQTTFGQNTIFRYQFGWNTTSGNLISRLEWRSNGQPSEIFAYDNLDRLTQVTRGSNIYTTNYDTKGNITYKKGVGVFNYEIAKPNAMTKVIPDGLGTSSEQIPAQQQILTYDGLSRPATLAEGGYAMNFDYAANGERRKSTLTYQGAHVETRMYAGDFERITKGGQVWNVHYISSPEGLVAMIVINGTTETIHYVFTDYLGSILKTVNSSGITTAEQSFDAWGRYRNPNNWAYDGNFGTRPDWLIRGYTGHEHLRAFALIHMNARLYDPITSRTLSPDNYVADADATQAYNRYSYCHNNPMKYTDPDGNLPILVAVALFGGALNMISNADNIAKDPWSAVGYFTSGAIGGMLSVTNPLAGGAFTTNMNIVTDIAFGNVPVISNTSDAVSYLGFKVLDGVGAAGTGQLVKGLFNFIGITSWSNTATLTGAAHLTKPGTSVLQGVTGPTVGIQAAKKTINAPVWILADEVATNATKTGTNFLKFGGDEAVVHFGKHADQIMKVTGKSAYNLKNYVDDANWIIQNGTYSSKLKGYYYYMGNSAKGESLFGFVGMKNGGSTISTFFIKTATKLGLN